MRLVSNCREELRKLEDLANQDGLLGGEELHRRLDELARQVRFNLAYRERIGRSRDESEQPVFFAAPSTLDEALERSAADYQERIKDLESQGILVSGRLPLVNPTYIGGVLADNLAVTPWGEVADVIKRDAEIQATLARLDTRMGIPIVLPDLRAGSLRRQINRSKAEIHVATHRDIDTFTPFDDGIVRIEDYQERLGVSETLSKKSLLEKGLLQTNGRMGVCFIDAGLDVPNTTLRMNMIDAVSHTREHALHVVAPETIFAAQTTSGRKLRGITWLDALDSGRRGFAAALFSFETAGILEADIYDRELQSGEYSYRHGVRREARVSTKGLEV